MNKLTYLLAALLLTLSASPGVMQAQDFKQKHPFPIEEGKVAYIDVVDVDSVTASGLYTAAIEFFSSNKANFRRSNSEKNANLGVALFGSTRKNAETVDALYLNEQPVSYESEGAKKIIVNVTNKYTGTQMGCIRLLYFSYDIITQFKEGRYRYEITNFQYTHYNQATMQQQQMYGMSDKGLCNSKNTLEAMLDCPRCKPAMEKLYLYLHRDTKSLINEMNEAIKIASSSEDSDW